MFRYLVFGLIFILYSDGVDNTLGTADDELWPLIQGKLDVLNKVGLSKDNFKVCVVMVIKDLLRRKKMFKCLLGTVCNVGNGNIMCAGGGRLTS
jgi:hypothetical protein